MSGQHFAMGIDVDAFALSLLQQQLQVVEIMTRDDDERSPFLQSAERQQVRAFRSFRC